MKKLYALTLLCLLAIAQPLRADEGMWLLPLIEKLNYAAMQQKGLLLSAQEIYSINNSSLKDAIVMFGGGCTGEIISPNGLLLTNHHCGYSSIQQHSSVEHDYLKNGFWAMSYHEEIPTPGLSVTFLESIEEVTGKIIPQLAGITDEKARSEKISELSKKLTATGTNTKKGITARIYSMFNGNAFYLFTYKTYNDVRFVGAPPSSIGKFGADTDNWMWPRHTGDFSLFRVYTDKKGNPAGYSAGNIPLKPKRYLNISIAGFDEGDYAMVMGNPGNTNRYMTSWEVKQMMDVANEIRIYVRGIRQGILLEDMLADPKIKIQYASKYSLSTNFWKNSIGMNRGLKRLNVIGKKETTEKQFAGFVAKSANPDYQSALDNIRQAIDGRENDYRTMQYYGEIFRAIEICGIAGQAENYLNALKTKKAKEIDKAKEAFSKAAETFYKDYSKPTDLKVTKALLKIFTEKVAQKDWPAALADAYEKHNGNLDEYTDGLFENSLFAGPDKVNEFIQQPAAERLENDPAFRLALAVKEKSAAINAGIEPYNRQLTKGRRHFIAGLMEMENDKAFYPDANFSTRLTYGNILSYHPANAVHYNYYTTLDGVMEKEDPNNWEFVVPDKLKQLYETKDYGRYAMDNGEMPVAFISNNDITGGNSGSPVLNGRGELIGCAFDGNWEAMSGDIAFEPELQRCINVDIRYILFIIDKYAGATHLINEMTIVE